MGRRSKNEACLIVPGSEVLGTKVQGFWPQLDDSTELVEVCLRYEQFGLEFTAEGLWPNVGPRVSLSRTPRRRLAALLC